ERHRDWLDSTNASLSWRATAPLRAVKRSLATAGSAIYRPPAEAADRAAGRIAWPPDGSERPRGPLDVHGWCLFPGSTVARVEVRLNGGPAVRARLAVGRPSSAPDSAHPDAPICGFEHKPDLAELAPGATTVRVDAVAHAIDGRRFALDPVVYPLIAAPEPSAGRRADAAVLRPRSARPRALGASGELRLLAFTHTLGYGGGSLYLLELLRRLRRRPGLRCEVVSLADGPLRDLLEDAGIPVHVTDGHAVASAARYEGHIAELTAWTQRRGFDAVLVNTLAAFAGADLAARLGLPAVWVVHESFPLPMFWFTAFPPQTLDPYVRAQAEGVLRSTSAVLFVAEATRRLFVADADPERLVTLPYGVELDAIDAARRTCDRAATRRRLGIDERARVVLCLGTIEPRKSQAMLAQAFAQVAGRHPDAQVVLVGATDDAYCADYRAALGDYIERAGLAGRVRVERVTDDPWSWHAVADLLVCASDIESLPRSITEAMAFGTPVLSTRVFGVPELIEDGVGGFLCELRNVAGLAAGLDRVLGMDREELAAVARAGRERVRARHDPDVYAAGVLRLLEGLVAHPEALPGHLLAREPAPAAAVAAP
ncbi:MAG: UDP-glucose:(heptosyl)LPS alpha,3-glucosyltransferase, partial [Thermoleophilaceae bacterium]|nr:UDP-glucose:(heptosyl)LPS alpha,3-glucosyltransferase [Thermoleophilaceae bacterium]